MHHHDALTSASGPTIQMPLKLSELIAMSAKRSFEYEGNTVNLEIFTQKMTPRFRAEWQDLIKSESKNVLCQICADFLKSWDVLGDDDQMQPITYEFLMQCPEGFLSLLSDEVYGVVFPNPTNASSSPSGSQPTTTQPAN